MDSSPQYFEYIVVGLGGIGSGALYWLSKRAGKSVLGLEQFKLGHDHGGSQDHSRIIRLMYDDDIYTNLTPHTYAAWDEVQRESGIQLYWKTGEVNFTYKGSAREKELDSYVRAMDKKGILYKKWTGTQLRQHFPQFNTDDSISALYQKDGGLVDAALANSVHIQLARGQGATIIEQCPVFRVQPTADGQTLVFTPHGTFKCRRLIVTAGAWINHVLGSVGVHIPVTVTQEQVTYFASPNMKKFTKDKFPIFLFQDDKHDYYSLPIHNNSGIKLGIDAGGPEVTAHTRSYQPDPAREKACRDFFAKYVPEAVGPILYSKTCLYTMTKDRHFVIDDLNSRNLPQIVFCCGAGHAFKFSSLLGRILSEMAIDGKTQYTIAGFTMNRAAITDPNFRHTYQYDFNNPTPARL